MEKDDSTHGFNQTLVNLLFAQFSGPEGELPMAIAYLTQATNENDPLRKATLVRIAKEKIKHAELLGAMLLQLKQRRTGPLFTHFDRDELQTLLSNKGIGRDSLEQATALLKEFPTNNEAASVDRHYAIDPKFTS